MKKSSKVNKIFKTAKNKEEAICPPSQVFVRTNFDFIFDFGGGLVEDRNEYQKVVDFLKTIGETEFYISENIGATLTERNKPFEATIDLEESYELFQQKVNLFEPPFGWRINHFYIYGQNENWGIYICEYPTVNIIGCDKEVTNQLRQVFAIDENGNQELKELILNEYKTKPDLLKEFIDHYKLKI